MTIPKGQSPYVFTVPDFMTPAACRRMIARAEAMGFAPATITSDQGAHHAPDIRNNDRVMFDDPDLGAELWKQTQTRFGRPFDGRVASGLNPRFRVYRYGPGQFFDWHQDGSYGTAEHSSLFTMMIYLNEGCDGGGTRFADVFSPHVFADFTIRPETGLALFFHHPLSHRGDPIESGVKYVLRTDVMFTR